MEFSVDKAAQEGSVAVASLCDLIELLKKPQDVFAFRKQELQSSASANSLECKAAIEEEQEREEKEKQRISLKWSMHTSPFVVCLLEKDDPVCKHMLNIELPRAASALQYCAGIVAVVLDSSDELFGPIVSQLAALRDCAGIAAGGGALPATLIMAPGGKRALALDRPGRESVNSLLGPIEAEQIVDLARHTNDLLQNAPANLAPHKALRSPILCEFD